MIITKLEQRDIPGCREIYNYYVKNTSFSLEETELSAVNKAFGRKFNIVSFRWLSPEEV